MKYVMELKNVSFGYNGEICIRNFTELFSAEESVIVTGISGCGKSTLLHLMAQLLTPTSGEIVFLGNRIQSKIDQENVRRDIGLILQFHSLLSEFSAVENVALPLIGKGVSIQNALQIARKWLKNVGLEKKENSNVLELSGGEQQRVSVARAFVQNPKLILADEATGNLDEDTALNIVQLCIRYAKEIQAAMVWVSHDLSHKMQFDKHIILK